MSHEPISHEPSSHEPISQEPIRQTGWSRSQRVARPATGFVDQSTGWSFGQWFLEFLERPIWFWYLFIFCENQWILYHRLFTPCGPQHGFLSAFPRPARRSHPLAPRGSVDRLRWFTPRRITLRWYTLRCFTLRWITLRWFISGWTTSKWFTLKCFTSRWLTLRWITVCDLP